MRGSFRYPCVPQTSLAVAKMVRGKRKHCVRRKCRVREPLTEELLNELLSSPDPNSFLLSANPSRRSLSEYLQQLLDEKGLERSKVVREAGLNDTFGYQIFKGTRKASRDKVLQLAFAMQLGLRETDRLLQAAGAMSFIAKIDAMPLLSSQYRRAIPFKRSTKNCIVSGKKPSAKCLSALK